MSVLSYDGDSFQSNITTTNFFILHSYNRTFKTNKLNPLPDQRMNVLINTSIENSGNVCQTQ